MKKKVIISFLLISLMILGISTVYADVVFGDFKPYSSDQKIEEFNNRIQSPLKEIAIILLILFIVLGLVLITFKFIKSNNENKLKKVLEKMYLLISFILGLVFIYFLKVVNVFIIEFMTGTLKYKMIDEAKITMIVFSIIYIITFIILSIISIKKKNKKFIFIPSTIFVIAIILICFIKFDNARIGVYVVDDSWFNTTFDANTLVNKFKK